MSGLLGAWIWHKNKLGETQDIVTFNKNTLRYFSVLCTLRMPGHSGHDCIVMYKCKVNVVVTVLLYTQAFL